MHRGRLGRYHRAIELMDEKLAAFYDAARGAHLLDDTLLIVTSDHGEAFGEHDLYFHDASVYDTHLHVPLWIHHPDRPPAVVDEVVSLRAVFDLIRAVGLGRRMYGTLLDPAHRRAHPVALAEHFHYPYTAGLLARYTQNLAAAVVGGRKIIVRREGTEIYDLGRDADETTPAGAAIADFEAACRRDGLPAAAIAAAAAHVPGAAARDRARVGGSVRSTPLSASVNTAPSCGSPQALALRGKATDNPLPGTDAV